MIYYLWDDDGKIWWSHQENTIDKSQWEEIKEINTKDQNTFKKEQFKFNHLQNKKICYYNQLQNGTPTPSDNEASHINFLMSTLVGFVKWGQEGWPHSSSRK